MMAENFHRVVSFTGTMWVASILSILLLSCRPSVESIPPTVALESSPPVTNGTNITATTVDTQPGFSLTSTPQPTPSQEIDFLERVWFTVATATVSRRDSVIAFANIDGTGLDFPALFEPYRSIGNAGQYLAWSPNGQYLAFDGANETHSCDIPEGTDCIETNYGISVADMETSVIVSHLEGTLTNPSWSPDSQYLVISKRNIQEDQKNLDNWAGDLYRYSVETKQSEQITTGLSSDIYPAWSPNGEWIAFLRYSPNLPYCGQNPSLIRSCNRASLYLVHPDGTDMKLLNDNVYVEAGDVGQDLPYNAPVWSPDSNRIVVLVGDERPDIALINIDSNEIKLLVASEGKDYYPTLSPDGNTLAFVSDREGTNDIYLISVEGTNLLNLTRSQTRDYAPVWSLSGQYIAFLSNHDLYVMKADGSEPVQIMGNYLSVIGRPEWQFLSNP